MVVEKEVEAAAKLEVVDEKREDELVENEEDNKASALLEALKSDLVVIYDLETGEIISTGSATDDSLSLDSPLDTDLAPTGTRETPASLKNLEDLAKVVRSLLALPSPAEANDELHTDARIHRRRSPRPRSRP